MAGLDSDLRHWRFVYQSLENMQSKLIDIKGTLHIFHNEVLTVFEEIEKILGSIEETEITETLWNFSEYNRVIEKVNELKELF